MCAASRTLQFAHAGNTHVPGKEPKRLKSGEIQTVQKKLSSSYQLVFFKLEEHKRHPVIEKMSSFAAWRFDSWPKLMEARQKGKNRHAYHTKSLERTINPTYKVQK